MVCRLMGGHHHARDDGQVSIWRVFGFMLGMHRDKFYGELRMKFRGGEVVGQLHVEQDILATNLPEATPAVIQELQKGVECRQA